VIHVLKCLPNYFEEVAEGTMDPVLMGQGVFFDIINAGEKDLFSGLYLTWRKEP